MKLYNFSLWLFALMAGLASASVTDFESFKDTFNIQEHMGSLSIYHEPYLGGLSSRFPESCEIRQLHVLQRHGSRNPTAGDSVTNAGYLSQVQDRLLNGSLPINYTVPGNPFQFIKSWIPVIDTNNADKLSSSGRLELFEMGREILSRYSTLFDSDVYEINTAAQNRVVESATWYSYGMFGEEMKNKSNFIYVPEDESAGSATLSDFKACPVFNEKRIDHEKTKHIRSQWEKIFLAPIRTRLNPYFLNYSLTNDDVRSFFYLCAFEVALKDGSDFCSLFTSSEIINFEYDYDLKFSFHGGPASKWSSIVGGAYVNNLAESLRSVNNETNNQKTFFAFTHDTHIFAVEAALGFFPDITPETPLPATKNPYTYSAKTSSFVPFAGNLITELFQCQDQKYYVRHLVNQQVFPLTDCGYGPSHSSDGMCELSAYLNSPVRFNSTNNGTNIFNAACKAQPTNLTVHY
ncbi:thiamine-repressible acid phosphatase Pho4 [Schizosaccharomyces octosporus yFS286]|uniref:Thiamine-repressible acid phosphatase Pho4 n=1 Tax=Schizosaccharomyces octosporus (strain yFS286) TaxID=483514 RepID=S9RFP1_SCHOY|nr:thiamine-repressible acid phosphatase Pho4 [Schizosaccharomyces octosporus yFS286]EPX72899.1 thiamine-repressible acid phosphatase Pho4 [Schizosaccharomyces octosporus yFS286]